MKTQILSLLKTAPDIVSGESLSTRLGTSRVTVWKHIRALQEAGYEIVSTPKGYRLESTPDLPYPWEFPARADRIHFYPEVESTMIMARNLARKGCPHFTAVVCGRQSKGRGRLDRTWVSEKGGLYFTLVVRPEIPALLASRINFLSSYTLAKLLRERYGVEAGVKWPNDILAEGRKLCGLLSEMETDGEMTAFVNIGIGINVSNDPAGIEPPAVSMRQLMGREVSRVELLSRFLDDLEQRMETADYESVIDQWKTLNVTLGKDVRVVTFKETLTGRAVDVASDGALLLELPDGTEKRVIYGDCFPLSP